MAREPETAGTSERALVARFEAGQGAPATRPAALGGLALAPSPFDTPAELDGSPALLHRLRSRRVVIRPHRMASAFRTAIEAELDQGAAFLAMPVCLAAGALLYFSLDAEPRLLPLMLAGLVLASARSFSSSRPWLGLALSASLLVVAGMGLGSLETWRHGTRMLGGDISTRLTGEVVSIDHLANRRVRLTLDVVATERPVLRYVPQRIRASARAIPEAVRIGSRVTGIVRLLPISGPLRPGSYDFSFDSYFDGLGATGFFLKGPDLVPDLEPPAVRQRLAVFIENSRLAIADRIRDRIGGAEGEIAAALVVGVRAGIPEEVNEALRRSGLYHVISISGLHMALVAGTIMGALRLALAFFPGFSSRYPVKKFAALAALCATAAYLFFSGAEVAAQRSFLMLAVMLAAVLFDRPAITMRNLAIAATVVIVTAPHEVMGPSFQMSFAAAAALIGTYAAWSQYSVSRRRGRAPVQRSIVARAVRALLLSLVGLAATSLIAGLATAIFGAYHFQRVSPLGLGANLAAMPAVSVLVMPFAVLAAAAMPFGLDGPFLNVMGVGLKIMVAVAGWFSERSPLDAIGTVPAASVLLLAAALLVATFATTWLRIAAVPLTLAGLASVATGMAPDVLVAEDVRLVAVGIGNDSVAVNRPRPSSFILEDWQRSFAVRTVVRPTQGDLPAAANGSGAAFHCREGLCLARHPSGAVIAHAADAAAAERACAVATLLIVDDATIRKPCRQSATITIGKRASARRGAASIRFSAQGKPIVSYAITAPYRPWHDHRRFSRAARGLPDYRRQNDKQAGTSAVAEGGIAEEPADALLLGDQ